MAVWASVSIEVDGRISEQAKAGVFPVRLKPEDWKSGDTVWLLDVIAPTRELATMMLTNFHQVAKRADIKIHPMVAHLVDRDVLAKLTANATSADLSNVEFGSAIN
ncbi:toxin-activating lysine-acyltransferase [Rhizobium sp. BK591]|uniref:toxin-activating lysine-acyltransferase n=1 Tax=Rhizobium sp. BK591 TaxID=2586985 RepID=UPI0028B14703|nr:toxin-activating lysine-acyltransferase [Rhizobium sp. BK591]